MKKVLIPKTLPKTCDKKMKNMFNFQFYKKNDEWQLLLAPREKKKYMCNIGDKEYDVSFYFRIKKCL